MSRKGRPPIIRFLEKIKVNELKVWEGSPCWEWDASANEHGYGRFVSSEGPYAHQFAYGYFVGPINDDLEIDHECRNRRCQNPLHLEAVTHQVNKQRAKNAKTECINGHPYIEENSFYNKKGERTCKACRLDSIARWRKNHPEKVREISRIEKRRQRAKMKTRRR